MQLRDLTVEVRDINYRRKALVDLRHARMTLMPAFRNIGSWELELPRDHPAVPHLRQPGSGIIATGPGGTFLTGRMITADSTASADAPEGLVHFSGVTDEIVLQDRLAWPVPSSPSMQGQAGAERDSRTGPAETVMHGFVNANAGPMAPAVRRTAHLTMGTDLGRGEVLTQTSRFANLLNVVREVAEDSGMGFRVVQVGEGIQFECYEPRDMRREIRFDLWNNTLVSYSVEEAGATLTHAIVGGRGEGVERLFIQQTSDEAQEQIEKWGRRIEDFLDWRATDDIDELFAAANRSLRVQGGSQNRVQFVPTDEHTMRFLRDWNLGDQVTAVVEGREISAWVSQAVIRVDTNGVRVGAILGNVSDTPEQMRDVETRLGRLERELEMTSASAVPEPMTGVPVGTVVPWAGDVGINGPFPENWLRCVGQAVLRADFPELFATIGTRYGAGNGTTTFNVPDLHQRVPVGMGGNSFAAPGAPVMGGTAQETLTVQQMPSHTHIQNPHTHLQNAHNHTQNAHNHTQDAHNHTQNAHSHGPGNPGTNPRFITTADGQAANVGGGGFAGMFFNQTVTAAATAVNQAATAVNQAATAVNQTATAVNQTATAVNQSTGGGQAHNNLQPYTVMHYIIKARP